MIPKNSARSVVWRCSTHADLSEAERTEIERQVAPIEDQKLREALENAMRASAEWAKGVQSKKEP